MLDKAVVKLTEQIGDLQSTLDWAKVNLRGKLPNSVETHIFENYVSTKIEPTTQALRELRKALGSDWRLLRSHVDNNGNRWLKYALKGKDNSFPEHSLTVIMDIGLIGETCQLVKVGEETIVREKFRVVCV